MFSQADIEKMLEIMTDSIIAREVEFCEYDSVAGDGDFGMSLAKGFRELKKQWDELGRDDISALLRSGSLIITEFCGGASGPIWGSAFRSAARAVKGKTELSADEFATMLLEAAEGIMKRGGAKLGDKTLLDALIPAAEALKAAAPDVQDGKMSTLDFLAAGAQAAEAGAERTKEYAAARGRATYVGDRSIGSPDAGAKAIAVLFQDILAKWPT